MAWQAPKTNWAATDGVSNADLNRIEGNIAMAYVPTGSTTNAGNAYSVTVPNYTAYVDLSTITVKFNAASSGAITINVNGLGAKGIIDYFGNAVTNVRANLIASLAYDATSGNFILQGKGGGGNTIAAHVLINETCTVDAGSIVGTMPNRANTKFQICGYENITEIIPHPQDPNGQGLITGLNAYGAVGYIDANSQIQMSVANLVPANIKQGVVIGRNNGTGSQVMVGTLPPCNVGSTTVVGSSHPVNNAPVDLASIRLEFYNRIFPNNTGTIQVLKNGVTNVVGSTTINTTNTANATDIESAYITLSESFYPGTLYKVILPAGALKDKLGNALSAMEYDFTTNTNPSAWATVPGGMTVQYRYYHGCVGTQSAAYAFCGNTNGGNGVTSTENFNGTSWASGVNAYYAFKGFASFGTQIAAVTAGGSNSSSSNQNGAQTYNGASWTTTGNITYTGWVMEGFGVQNAGVISGGATGSYTWATNLYNGSTFASSGNMAYTRCSHGAMGVQNAGLVAGGEGSNNTSEKFNGATWTTAANILTPRGHMAAAGTQDAGLIFGSNTATTDKVTEKFNGLSWSSTNSMNTDRWDSGGCGTQTSALVSGGQQGGSTWNYWNTCEKFFG